MNERIQALAIEASADLDPEDYMGASEEFLELFAQLLVQECCNRLSKETIRHDGYGYNQHALYRILREHFGVAE
jgi:hypothetical protein